MKDDVCTVEPIDPNVESLGQKLLRKQTEVYGLTKLSYSEESAAQSIKIYNPNDMVYDYYWFDHGRNKGIRGDAVGLFGIDHLTISDSVISCIQTL